MADVVQMRLERMIPELDDLEKKGLYTAAEIKQIVKKRRDFEYRLKRPQPLKHDFVRYIDYEKQLDALRVLRAKELKKQLKAEDKKWHFSLSDKASKNHVIHLYERLLSRFPGDLRIWFEFAEYCRSINSSHQLKKVIGKALKFHPNVPELYIYYASWEFEHNLDIHGARSAMLRALRACPNSDTLWLEYFRMELSFVNKLRARKVALGADKVSSLRDEEEHEEWKGGNSDLFMSLDADNSEESVENEKGVEDNPGVAAIRELGFKMAYIIFTKAVQAIPTSAQFRQQFLEMLDAVDVQKGDVLEDEICRSIMNDFPTDESCWDWLARRHLSKAIARKHVNREKLVEALNNASQVYEDALKNITTAKMYGLYVTFLETILGIGKSESNENLEAFRKSVSNLDEIAEKLLKLFQRAECSGCLNEDLAVQHVSFISRLGDTNRARDLATKFCNSEFSKVTKLWVLRICLEIKVMMNSVSRSELDKPCLLKLFKSALEKIPVSDSCELWNMAMELFSNHRDCFNKIIDLLASALSSGGGGKGVALLACTVLNWVSQNHGVEKARKVYNRFLSLPKPSLEFYKHCILFESQLSAAGCDNAHQNMRKLFDSALQIYDQNTDMWLFYCSEELKAGKSDAVSTVYWRAKKTLRDSSAFMEAFQSLDAQATVQSR